MAAPRPGEILLVASAIFFSTIGLWYTFANYEVARWWTEQPASLAVLVSMGLLISIAGATLPHFLSLPRMRVASKRGEIAVGAVLGLAFGLGGGAVGWIAADVTPWVLLPWFFVVAFILSCVRITLPRDQRQPR